MSPEPDVCVFDLDVTRHRALVLASDGLWNMVRPQECIDIVLSVDENNEKLVRAFVERYFLVSLGPKSFDVLSTAVIAMSDGIWFLAHVPCRVNLGQKSLRLIRRSSLPTTTAQRRISCRVAVFARMLCWMISADVVREVACSV